MPRDRDRVLRFAPLQGETAKRYLNEAECSDLETVVVVRIDGPTPIKLKMSTAILYTLSLLPQPWRLLSKLGMLVPSPLRDLCYQWVAKNRFKIMGKKESCRLPTKEEAAQFLP
jgi:predicted DCC family thiol-disulfide oxidoreductase YuxK